MKQTIVLYHRGCNDGIVAAWAAHTKFGDAAKYIAYQYGEELPVDVFGNHVIMVDLSLPEELLQKTKAEVESILIIDHHKTAMKIEYALQPVKTYSEYKRLRAQGDVGFMRFDLEHSGAVLTWAFFNDVEDIVVEELPWALRLIQDYDLWQHRFPDTKPVNAWLINGGLTIPRVAELMAHEGQIPPEVLAVGKSLMAYDDKIIRSVIREYLEVYTTPDGFKFVMVNAPHHLRNEIGDRLSTKYDFVVLYTRRKERTVYSLRARKGGFDTSTISERYGGGGHAEASAFSIAHPVFTQRQAQALFGKPASLLNRLSMAWDMFRGLTH